MTKGCLGRKGSYPRTGILIEFRRAHRCPVRNKCRHPRCPIICCWGAGLMHLAYCSFSIQVGTWVSSLILSSHLSSAHCPTLQPPTLAACEAIAAGVDEGGPQVSEDGQGRSCKSQSHLKNTCNLAGSSLGKSVSQPVSQSVLRSNSLLSGPWPASSSTHLRT